MLLVICIEYPCQKVRNLAMPPIVSLTSYSQGALSGDKHFEGPASGGRNAQLKIRRLPRFTHFVKLMFERDNSETAKRILSHLLAFYRAVHGGTDANESQIRQVRALLVPDDPFGVEYFKLQPSRVCSAS